MPRLHYVKKARKDNPVAKKGESYYWWQPAFSFKRYSKEMPPRSQYATQSAFLSALYDLEDNITNRFDGVSDADEIQSVVHEIRDELQELYDQCEESFNNIPEQLQYASAGELLQERIDNLDQWMNDIDCIECEIQENEEPHDTIERIVDDIMSSNPGF